MTPFWDKRVADWTAARIPGFTRGFGPCQALGVTDGKQIVGGVVFHDWNPEAGTVELSAAASDRRWMTRAVMNTVFRYVFDELGCQMAVARTESRNTPVRKLWAALGASEVIIPRLFGRGVDGAVLTLPVERWKASKFFSRRP